MLLKPQDILVTLKVHLLEGPVTLAELSQTLKMSASEVHAASKRAVQARLARVDSKKIFLANRENLLEFLRHGIAYAFPPDRGAETRGLPTGAAAPVLREYFARGKVCVWPDPLGGDRGESFSPLYRSVPFAAKTDSKLYAILALTDVLRGGTARERGVAIRVLDKELP